VLHPHHLPPFLKLTAGNVPSQEDFRTNHLLHN
jgi:hypothetical protein